MDYQGLAYERLGDKNKAAGSYGRALNIRPKDGAARSGFTRVSGRPDSACSAKSRSLLSYFGNTA